MDAELLEKKHFLERYGGTRILDETIDDLAEDILLEHADALGYNDKQMLELLSDRGELVWSLVKDLAEHILLYNVIRNEITGPFNVNPRYMMDFILSKDLMDEWEEYKKVRYSDTSWGKSLHFMGKAMIGGTFDD